jgi:hypothetical protein
MSGQDNSHKPTRLTELGRVVLAFAAVYLVLIFDGGGFEGVRQHLSGLLEWFRLIWSRFRARCAPCAAATRSLELGDIFNDWGVAL